MQIKKQKSLIQEFRDEYQANVKKLKRKKFLLKARLMLTIILPVFIILLSVNVIKTFVRIKVRDIFSIKPKDPKGKVNTQVLKSHDREEEARPEPDPQKSAIPVPAVMTPVEKEMITPVPVITEPVTVSE